MNDLKEGRRVVVFVEARGRTCGGMTSALKQIVENSLRFDDSVIDSVPRPVRLPLRTDGRMGLFACRRSRGLTKCRFLPSSHPFFLPPLVLPILGIGVVELKLLNTRTF